jgi:hypothetical protein
MALRGGAGSEIVPSSSRQDPSQSPEALDAQGVPMDDIGIATTINELRGKAYKVKIEIADIDIKPVVLPLNSRFNLIIYADASFAVGDTMQSVSYFPQRDTFVVG